MSRSRCSRGVHWRRVAPRQGSSLCLPRDVFLSCCGSGVLALPNPGGRCPAPGTPSSESSSEECRPPGLGRGSCANQRRRHASHGVSFVCSPAEGFLFLGPRAAWVGRGHRGEASGASAGRPGVAGVGVGGASPACRTRAHHEARGQRSGRDSAGHQGSAQDKEGQSGASEDRVGRVAQCETARVSEATFVRVSGHLSSDHTSAHGGQARLAIDPDKAAHGLP